MGGRTRRRKREERERREEGGRFEGAEAARTDGCCQGSAKKVEKVEHIEYQLIHTHTCAFCGKNENLFGIVEAKGISASHPHLVPG